MKVNMAVYTAVHGFDWQPGTVFERRELNRFYEMIGDFPDIMMQKVPFGGAFVCDGRFVFYRFHVNVHGDSRGRDALYCVVGAVPVEDALRLDLAQVMTAPEFVGPVKPFPVEMEGMELVPAESPKTRRELQSRVDAIAGLNDIGACAAHYSRGSFVCRITETEGRFAFKVQCANPDIVDPQPKPVVVESPYARRSVDSARPSDADRQLAEARRENERLRMQIDGLEQQKRSLENRLSSSRNRLYLTAGLCSLLFMLTVFRGCSTDEFLCPECWGKGSLENQTHITAQKPCEECRRTGKITTGFFRRTESRCPACGGKGEVTYVPEKLTCQHCQGSGKVSPPKEETKEAK